MASTFQFLLERAETLSTQLCELFGRSPPSISPSQIEEDLERLRRRMGRIRALLDDAEEREIREKSVRLWLDELRDVAYGAEDVIEAFEYEVQRYQMWCRDEEQTPIGSSKKASIGRTGGVSNSPDQPRCAPLSDPSFLLQAAAKIKSVTDRFDEIYGDGLALKLHEKDGRQRTNLTSLSDPSARPPTSSLLADEEGILGREVDKHNVMKLLLSDVGGGGRSGKNVRVVSIVGMAGVGKTTLAQLVYNDIPEVRDRFDTRLWIHVSESFEVRRLTNEILEAIQGEPSAFQGFSILQETLQKKMEGKRFLLVLDDVWNESLELWDTLLVPLLKAAEGSRVLITTRSEVVSRVSNAIEGNLYRLGYLSFEDSWTLFEQRVFGDWIGSSDHPRLVSIGSKIVRNCGGLPLAVKTLAGLLRSIELSSIELSEMWEDVLRSDLWELPEGQDQILPALRLSYHHLTSAVKPCFAYCAVFPKNHNFDRDALVLMWMAQGYLRATPRQSMEDVGRRHFTDLLQRSFFQEQGNGYYIMHDLTHDLALSVCGSRIHEAKARHLSLERGEDIMRFLSAGPPVHGSTGLRTFGVFKILWGYTCSRKAVNNLLSSMKYLRVLDLRGVEISDLPDPIGNLMLLRYLAVGRSLLRKLPETLGDLLNLQTLDVSEAYNLQELPVRVAELINLRHLILHVAGHGGLQRMPPGIGRLTQLQTLSRFVVGAGDVAAGIEELTDLNDLKGKLEIKIRSPGNNSWSSNTSPWKEAILSKNSGGRKKACSILMGKHGLGSLALIFHCTSDEEMMESLQPHSKIKELEVVGYDRPGLPKWMEAVPSGRAASPFPWLEKLRLHLLGLEGTLTLGSEDGRTSFPFLRHLTIEYCNSLSKLELWHLAALSELRVNCCTMLTRLDCHYDGKVSLGCGSWLLPPPPPSSSWSQQLQRQQPVVIDHIMEMPHITTIVLRSCHALTFPPQRQQQLQLSPSLRRFDFTGSKRLKDWARRNVHKAVGARGCHYVIIGAALQVEENFSNDVRVDQSIHERVVPQGLLEVRWKDGPSRFFTGRQPKFSDWEISSSPSPPPEEDCRFPSPPPPGMDGEEDCRFPSPPPENGGEERDGVTSHIRRNSRGFWTACLRKCF